ncbi:MAG: hypothetical protein ABR514_03300 [Chthoniobacterales bacterium]
MPPNQLLVYVNDHIAGSVAALELLEHLIKCCADEPLASFLTELTRDIQSDQEVLKKLLERERQKESQFRKLAAWVTEKFARSKFKFAGEQMGELGLVQALEMLALGIRGKELLWRALATSSWRALRDVDLAQLEQRAIEQQARVEDKRLAAARAAFR